MGCHFTAKADGCVSLHGPVLSFATKDLWHGRGVIAAYAGIITPHSEPGEIAKIIKMAVPIVVSARDCCLGKDNC